MRYSFLVVIKLNEIVLKIGEIPKIVLGKSYDNVGENNDGIGS